MVFQQVYEHVVIGGVESLHVQDGGQHLYQRDAAAFLGEVVSDFAARQARAHNKYVPASDIGAQQSVDSVGDVGTVEARGAELPFSCPSCDENLVVPLRIAPVKLGVGFTLTLSSRSCFPYQSSSLFSFSLKSNDEAATNTPPRLPDFFKQIHLMPRMAQTRADSMPPMPPLLWRPSSWSRRVLVHMTSRGGSRVHCAADVLEGWLEYAAETSQMTGDAGPDVVFPDA